MNGLPYYPRFPRDFLEGTAGWPLELKGAYAILLDLIYMHDGGLPDEPRFIAGHLGCSVRAWNIYRAQLIERGKIRADLGIISNFRADNLLEKTRSYQDNQREKARERWKNNGLRDAAALPVDMPQRCHTDTDTNKKKKNTPLPPKGGEDCSAILADVLRPETVAAFIAHRAAKRAKLTAHAAKLIVKKLAGAPDPDAVVERSIMNGWTGVFPESQPATVTPFPSREEARREKRHDDLQRIIAAAARGTT